MELDTKYGFHCIYQHANNEYYALNCKNVTNVTRYHANLLSQAGIDFIVFELTNCDSSKEENIINGYIRQIRPTQLLY